MKTSLALGNRRLLKLADILHVADEKHKEKGEPAYDQAMFLHGCDTPGCGLAHWAEANPRRWRFVYNDPEFITDSKGTRPDTMMEFSINNDSEFEELFSTEGCGNAQTAKQAAAYIRKFVKARMKK